MKYISVDVETLGLNTERHSLIEVGAVFDDLKTPIDKLPTCHFYVVNEDNTYIGDPFAMSMHSAILKRIANREEGFHYVPEDCVDGVFYDFIHLNCGYEPNEKVTIAGKNFGNFDMRFLRRYGFAKMWKMAHRFIDPGSMFLQKEDVSVPSLKLCLERSGVHKEVSHTAIDDAMDVVRLLRYKLCNQSFYVPSDVPMNKVEERLQDEHLGIVAEFPTFSESWDYVQKRRKEPLGTSSMFTIHMSNGEKVVV